MTTPEDPKLPRPEEPISMAPLPPAPEPLTGEVLPPAPAAFRGGGYTVRSATFVYDGGGRPGGITLLGVLFIILGLFSIL